MTGQTLIRTAPEQKGLQQKGDRLLILLLAFASGITVANIYYSQPARGIAGQLNANYVITSIISLVTAVTRGAFCWLYLLATASNAGT